MLVGIMIGQRTPGHTLAEARAFEEWINHDLDETLRRDEENARSGGGGSAGRG